MSITGIYSEVMNNYSYWNMEDVRAIPEQPQTNDQVSQNRHICNKIEAFQWRDLERTDDESRDLHH